MKENKRLAINFLATAVAFTVNAGINFLLSRYIVETVSEEAYGFIQFANTFVTYFTVLTIAINSMSSRFIAIEYYKNNKKQANDYYNSTLLANLLMMIITLPILVACIFNIEHLMQVSPELVTDVKILLLFLVGNLYLGLITTNLSVSYYIKNKLYVQSIINTISYILKAALLWVFYIIFPPYIAIFGVVTFLATGFVQLMSIYYKNKLIPEITIKNGKAQFQKIKTLISSGIWNSIIKIGDILSTGLDLLITNVMIGPTEMGILAIVKTIPNLIGSALNSLVSIFMPNMTKLYAEEKKQEFIDYVKKAMKIVGMFLNIPGVFMIVLGDILFKLWFPSQDSILLQVLSVISISQWIIIGPISIMHNVFTVVNKIKTNAILICITGVANILVVLVLLKTTQLGIFAVTMISCILSILRNLIYTLPFGATAIEAKWYEFFPIIGRSLIATTINVIFGYGIKTLIKPESWTMLIICTTIICIIAIVLNFFILFSKQEKQYVTRKIMQKVKIKE